jgi:hypothetical protein
MEEDHLDDDREALPDGVGGTAGGPIVEGRQAVVDALPPKVQIWAVKLFNLAVHLLHGQPHLAAQHWGSQGTGEASAGRHQWVLGCAWSS